MMGNKINRQPIAISIWFLALGYFVFYIPYSLLTKTLSSDLLKEYGLISTESAISAAAFLPIVLVGTVMTMPIIICCLGWYRYLSFSQTPKGSLSWPKPWIIYSGVAFAVIITTTTLAFSFNGVSIIFALLLMRGGVIALSPLIDQISRRQVHWYSWVGLGLSLLAVCIALVQVDDYQLNWAVLLNLLAYLIAYIFRLRLMSQYAKDAQEALNRRFFVEENTVAMVILVVFSILVLIYYMIENNLNLGAYIALMLTTGVIWPALLIGIFYACLGIFGSMIYLNRRENSFSIPVNRSASLLSGVLASLLLMLLFEGQMVSVAQFAGALTIGFALFLMAYFDKHQVQIHRQSIDNPLQRIWLFICDGNRMRSPMAAAICNRALAGNFSSNNPNEKISGIMTESAGLQLGKYQHMPEPAKQALIELGISPGKHQATQVTDNHIRRAESVFCMNDAQRFAIIEQFPWAETKVFTLGDKVEVAKPSGEEKQHFIDLAHRLNQHIQRLLLPLIQGENHNLKMPEGYSHE